MQAAAIRLPPLRDELTIHEGPRAADGSPVHTLHDPLRNRFFRLSWPAFEIVSRWHLKDPEAVAASVRAETTLEVEAEDVAELAETLMLGQLLRPAGPGHTRRLLGVARAARTSWAEWLLHHYLFFRIPLVRPDRLLEALLPRLAWLGGRSFRLATLAAFVLGLVLIGRQWNVFTATFVDQFSMAGLVSFGIALGVAKIAHELGHALTAKAFGLRVPTMGVAFLVMWPVLYTDVNEAWKLPDRRRRLLIGGAGVLTELTLAAWAGLAWALLPEGSTARQMAFTLAATTWISSLLINLSPFMRFDGYFLLGDALDMPNLHDRAFALARNHLRRVLFGLDDPAPEPLSDGRRRFLILFAWAVWIYRLTLFLGIAVLVYHFFIKVVGVLLFVVEIGWFVIKPIWGEIKAWRGRAAEIRANRRSRLTLALGGAALLLVLIPWNGRISAPAMLKASEHVAIYPPVPGILLRVEAKDGDRVQAGAILAVLDNPDLDYRVTQAERRIRVLRYELAAAGFDQEFRGRMQAVTRELEAALAELAATRRDRERLTLTAPAAGIIGESSPQAQLGQWLSPREPLMAVRGPAAVIEAYVDEDDLPRIREGAAASFLPEGTRAALAARVEAIDRTAVRSLSDPALAASYGGSLPARFSDKALVPDVAVYRVHLRIDGDSQAVMLRGQVHIDGEGRSLIARALRAALAVLIREFGV